MNSRQISILAAVLAVGCARGQSEESAARAGDESRGGERAEHESRDGEPAEGERVEIPNKRQGRGRMASASDELPREVREKPDTAEEFGTDADNTRVNERDRDSAALTPMDQSEETSDRDLTARIRKSIIADDSLSFTAKNVKIITRDGQVTLRGTVNNENERTTIERTAREAAGNAQVVNELEVSD
jgi:hyperosmotically inducible periplasmic protein